MLQQFTCSSVCNSPSSVVQPRRACLRLPHCNSLRTKARIFTYFSVLSAVVRAGQLQSCPKSAVRGRSTADPSVDMEIDADALKCVAAKVAEARHRDQPAAGFHIDNIDDNVHKFDRGVADGVTMLRIDPREGQLVDTPWVAWTDTAPGAGETKRGGACVYKPTDQAVRKDTVALFIHGGGFEGFSPLEGGYDKFGSRLARDLNMIVVCPDHPLSGDRPFRAPEILAQLVLDALWLMKNDPTMPATPLEAGARVVLVGDSAGATQAMSVLLALAAKHAEHLSRVQGVVLVSPWLDMSCGSHTYVSNAFAQHTRTGDVAFQSPPDENRDMFRTSALRYLGTEALVKDVVQSPYWLCRGLPGSEEIIEALQRAKVPIWMCIGHAETLMGEVLDFATRLRSSLPIEVWLHEGMFHDWILYSSDEVDFPSKKAAYRNIVDFISRSIKAEPVTKPGIHFYIDEW